MKYIGEMGRGPYIGNKITGHPVEGAGFLVRTYRRTYQVQLAVTTLTVKNYRCSW